MAEEKKEIKKEIKDIADPLAMLDEIEKIGKKEKWVDISKDSKILLTTINAEDEVEIFKACKSELGFGYLAKNKFEVLARSIKGINKMKFKYVDMEDGPERNIERERIILEVRKRVESWHDDVVSFVYAEWLALTGDVEEYLKKIGIIVDMETEEKLDELKNELEEKAQTSEQDTKLLKREGSKEISK